MGRSQQKRMEWGDYAVVYFIQSMPIGESAPSDSKEMVERYGRSELRPLLDEAMQAASELFGGCNSSLYEVERLTIKEGSVAARFDLTHEEKLEQIRPLREKRERDADKRSEKRAREYEARWEAEQEKRISAAVAETMAISDEDRSWASKLKIKLD
ncbi:MAG: hypothetical protein JSS95_06950 [Acidobacteria bacterium]|nr:hypothetical protein [Acidobacteriota bacterium]